MIIGVVSMVWHFSIHIEIPPAGETAMNTHESIILALRRAADQGETATKLKASKSPKIKQLLAEGAIRGPIKIGRANRYFLPEHAPTQDQVARRIEGVLRGAGLKLTSISKLDEMVKPARKAWFSDALSALKAEGRIVEVKDARRSKYYLHREPLLEQFGLDTVTSIPSPHPSTAAAHAISFDEIRSAYESVKAQQGGISAVTIASVLTKLSASRAELHQLMLDEVKKGRITLHRATSVNFPREVVDAGISLEGEQHPFVTFTIKEGA